MNTGSAGVCGVYHCALHMPTSRVELGGIFVNFQFFIYYEYFFVGKNTRIVAAPLRVLRVV